MAASASASPSAELRETRLVGHVMSLAARPLPELTRARLAQALLDWFTAGWSALDLPAAQRLRDLAQGLIPGVGASAVFGGSGAMPFAAAFANAGIAHLREIDDAHRAAMLHPGVIAISPVLALAPVLGLTQARVGQAIVAGYEVSLRLGEALGTRHAATFHATATAGAVGAAAATSVALGLGQAQLHHALGLAATQAAGLWQLVDDDAHESKSLHPAFAVRNGMTAAYAAAAGFPGARAFMTGRRGMLAALAGEGPLDAIDGALDAPARLHTATIKAWPACAQLFTPLDATRALMQEFRIGAADVEAVEIEIFPHALKIAGIVWPTKTAELPFCLRYLTAVLLLKGDVGIADTETADFDTPALRSLAERITVRPNEAFQKLFPERRPSRVGITLRDGRQLSAYRELRRGDPEDPFSWSELLARMHAFAPAMSAPQQQAVAQWCAGFADASRDAEPVALAAALFGAAAPG